MTNHDETRVSRWALVLAAAAATALGGCSKSDDAGATPDATGGDVDSGTAGDANRAPPDVSPIDTGPGGPPADTRIADSRTADTRDGGDAGDAGETGETGDDAGTAADCLPTSDFDAYFKLEDPTKCVVAQYTTPDTGLNSLTWGRHGGPLATDGSGSPLVRYSAPAGATGAMTATRTAVVVPGLPDGSFFWDSQALDLPGLGLTALAYTTTDSASSGELILVDATGAVAQRYHANGFYEGSAVTIGGPSGERLLWTGLSELSKSPTATRDNGLWSADVCGTGATTSLLATAPGCTPNQKIDGFGTNSGDITKDNLDDVFVNLPSVGATTSTYEVRGYESFTVSAGGGPTVGTKLFAARGYISEMVADGHAVIYQDHDSTFATLDPQIVHYAVDAAAHTITATDTPKTLLTAKRPGTSVALLVDPSNRLWVSVDVPGAGDAGPASSIFFVLRDKKP